MPLCVYVEFLCLSVYQPVCLSRPLSICIRLSVCLSVCMSVCLSVCLSLSLSLPLSLSQVFCWDSKSFTFLINLSWWKPIILNYAPFFRNHYMYPPMSKSRAVLLIFECPGICQVDILVSMISLLLAQLCITELLLG